MPRVTVFIPTYNRSHVLPQSIDAVLAQTYGDFVLEISDNASTDETPAVVARYDDSRIRYVRQPENLGILGNHNQFLERVDTEYAVIVPDDDVIYPRLLERTVAALDSAPAAGFVHTRFDTLDESGAVLLSASDWTYTLDDTTLEEPAEFIRSSMRWSCRVCASTALMRTEALPPGGMSADDFPAIDFGMWLRMAANGWSVLFLAESLAAYRIHGDSHSAAFGAPAGPGYVQGHEIVAQLRDVKLRFLAGYGEPAERQRLRVLAERSRHHDLLVMARNATLPERRRAETARQLARAVRADPGVALEGSAWKLAAASLLGPRVVTRLKEARGAKNVV